MRYEERLIKWKQILNRKENNILNTRHPEATFDTILNYQFTEKLMLMGEDNLIIYHNTNIFTGALELHYQQKIYSITMTCSIKDQRIAESEIVRIYLLYLLKRRESKKLNEKIPGQA